MPHPTVYTFRYHRIECTLNFVHFVIIDMLQNYSPYRCNELNLQKKNSNNVRSNVLLKTELRSAETPFNNTILSN